MSWVSDDVRLVQSLLLPQRLLLPYRHPHTVLGHCSSHVALVRCSSVIGLTDCRPRAPCPLEFPLLVPPKHRWARLLGHRLRDRVDGDILQWLRYLVGGGILSKLGLAGLSWRL